MLSSSPSLCEIYNCGSLSQKHSQSATQCLLRISRRTCHTSSRAKSVNTLSVERKEKEREKEEDKPSAQCDWRNLYPWIEDERFVVNHRHVVVIVPLHTWSIIIRSRLVDDKNAREWFCHRSIIVYGSPIFYAFAANEHKELEGIRFYGIWNDENDDTYHRRSRSQV